MSGKKSILVEVKSEKIDFVAKEDENEDVSINFSRKLEDGATVSGFGHVNWKAFPGKTDEEKKAAALKFSITISSTMG